MTECARSSSTRTARVSTTPLTLPAAPPAAWRRCPSLVAIPRHSKPLFAGPTSRTSCPAATSCWSRTTAADGTGSGLVGVHDRCQPSSSRRHRGLRLRRGRPTGSGSSTPTEAASSRREATGQVSRRLLTAPAWVFFPRLSPDGRRIRYTVQGESPSLWEGGRRRRRPPCSPPWMERRVRSLDARRPLLRVPRDPGRRGGPVGPSREGPLVVERPAGLHTVEADHGPDEVLHADGQPRRPNASLP